jgi:ABC-type Fe3+ transport system permease subunit
MSDQPTQPRDMTEPRITTSPGSTLPCTALPNETKPRFVPGWFNTGWFDPPLKLIGAGWCAPLVVAVCSGLPLAWMLGALLFASPQVRAELHVSSFRAELLLRTLAYNGLAAVIATLMGIPAGFVLGRGRGIVARVLWVLLPAALLMPSLSYTYGWSQLAHLCRRWLQPMGITFIPGGTADTLRCIWSLAAWLWAVPAGIIGLSLRRVDPGIQQQAMLDGALRRVTFRQLWPGIIASIAVVTMLATQEFAVYEPTGISVVATEVRMVFDTGAFSSSGNPINAPVAQGAGAKAPDQPERAAAAVATALPLVAVTFLLALTLGWSATASAAAETIAIGRWPRALDTSRWTILLACVLLLINVGVPVAALLYSLHVRLSPMHIWEEFRPEVAGALIVASIAAAAAALVAFSAAGRWTRGLLLLTGSSFLIGGQFLAIAEIRIYNRPGFTWVYNSFPAPVFAYLGRFGWLALVAARGAFSRPWREIREMASLDGAGVAQISRNIIWPLAWPLLLAAGLMVGALSITEVPATVLLFPQHPQVLTPLLMTWVHTARYDPMIEASLLMMAVVLIPALAAILLTQLGLKLTRRFSNLGAKDE